MPIDYSKIASNYFPKSGVNKLLIGEAPPPNGTSYFYIPKDRVRELSMPSTVFQHYFGKKPETTEEYEYMLNQLKNNNIFLMDICDLPLRISNRSYKGWVDPEKLAILISHIPLLREKIISRGINISDENIIFLPARNMYNRQIRESFPNSTIISWADFRQTRELLP